MIAKTMELKQVSKNDQVTGSPPPPSASPVLQQSPPQQEEQAPVMLTTMQPVPLSASEIHSYADDRQYIYQVDGKHVEFVRQVGDSDFPSNSLNFDGFFFLHRTIFRREPFRLSSPDKAKAAICRHSRIQEPQCLCSPSLSTTWAPSGKFLRDCIKCNAPWRVIRNSSVVSALGRVACCLGGSTGSGHSANVY